jgi:hypothetical protein
LKPAAQALQEQTDATAEGLANRQEILGRERRFSECRPQ